VRSEQNEILTFIQDVFRRSPFVGSTPSNNRNVNYTCVIKSICMSEQYSFFKKYRKEVIIGVLVFLFLLFKDLIKSLLQ
jgi:hypothetical protein